MAAAAPGGPLPSADRSLRKVRIKTSSRFFLRNPRRESLLLKRVGLCSKRTPKWSKLINNYQLDSYQYPLLERLSQRSHASAPPIGMGPSFN